MSETQRPHAPGEPETSAGKSGVEPRGSKTLAAAPGETASLPIVSPQRLGFTFKCNRTFDDTAGLTADGWLPIRKSPASGDR